MSVIINIIVGLSIFMVDQCPKIDEYENSYGKTIKVYAIDQPNWPVISYYDRESGGRLSVYRCSRQIFSPLFWGWIMIKSPKLWNVVRARNTYSTDFVLQFTNEILEPRFEQQVFRSYISPGKNNLKVKNADFSTIRTIRRCDMDSNDFYRLLLLMGSLGMDFSKQSSGFYRDSLGLYLLENDTIAQDPFSESKPKMDFEPLAALVTSSIFSRSMPKEQQKRVIDYAQKHNKKVFLRDFRILEMKRKTITTQDK